MVVVLQLVLLEERPPGIVDKHVQRILGLADDVEVGQAFAVLAAEVWNHTVDRLPHLWPVGPKYYTFARELEKKS